MQWCYSKSVRGGCPQLVVYEVDARGDEEFSNREQGEVLWYRFEPSADERNIARQIRERAESGGHELEFTSTDLRIMWRV